MAARKPARKPAETPDTATVGDVIPLNAGSLVRRPDGVVVTAGTRYVLDVPGEHTVITTDGTETTVTAEK